MGFRTITLSISFTREQFIYLLLLQGSIKISCKDLDSNADGEVVLNGCYDHLKRGQPGMEDGSEHSFTTYISYEDRILQAQCTVKSYDIGKTYRGSVTIPFFADDNLSE